MKRIFYFPFLLIIAVYALFSCESNQKENKDPEITLKWKLVSNGFKGDFLNHTQLTIANEGSALLKNKDWSLFFNNKPCTLIREELTSNGFQITHINGDFFRIDPTDKMKPLSSGDSVVIDLYSNSQMIKNTDRAMGFYFDFGGTIYEPKISYDPFPDNQFRLSEDDSVKTETALDRYKFNSKTPLIDLSPNQFILPRPISAVIGDGTLDLNTLSELDFPEELSFEGALIKEMISIQSTGSSKVKLMLKELDFSDAKEAYALIINEDGIQIHANERAGIFYAIQSLNQLMTQEEKLPFIEVKDSPRFDFRGLSIDVARNFQTKKELLKVLKVMGQYKVNKLQLQLSDDEGWRLDIPTLPELVEVGSIRSHDKGLMPSYGSGAKGIENISNGFYSKADFVEILSFAAKMNIEIMVQLEFPGHARASIEAMKLRTKRFLEEGNKEEAQRYSLIDPKDKSEYNSVQNFDDNTICPCQESTYNFINEVLVQLKAMYNKAGVPFQSVHLGGDEVAEGVWEESPKCKTLFEGEEIREQVQKYYVNEILKIGKKHNVHLAFWDDVAGEKDIKSELVNENLSVFCWNNIWGEGNEDRAYKLANAGYETILVPVSNLYFDQSYSKNAEEPGFYWGSYVNTYTAFSFLPDHMFKMDQKTKRGHEVTQEYLTSKVTLTQEGTKNIKGIEASLFTETIKGSKDLEYFIFPKLLGLAERAWAPSFINNGDSQEDVAVKLQEQWTVFANVVGQRELHRLSRMGIQYRVPPVGENSIDNELKMNTVFPGFEEKSK